MSDSPKSAHRDKKTSPPSQKKNIYIEIGKNRENISPKPGIKRWEWASPLMSPKASLVEFQVPSSEIGKFDQVGVEGY